MSYMVIAFGASIGAIARFHLSKLNALSQIPTGTMFANLLGSCLLGFFYFLAEKHSFSMLSKQFIQVGLLGALTTYSTINLELFLYLERNQIKLFLIYFFINSVCGILAIVIGKYLSEIVS
jgi:fluoride exporter